MTREEALHRVKGYLTDIIPAEDYSEVEEILKALDPEPCDDAVSRKYLLDCVVDKVTMPYVPISKIENAPPVVPCSNNVPDKIRAEIKGLYRVILKGTPKDDWAVRWNECLDEVLQIINKYKIESEGKTMLRVTRFSMFTDDELNAMESAFFNEGLEYLVEEIRKERRFRESWK